MYNQKITSIILLTLFLCFGSAKAQLLEEHEGRYFSAGIGFGLTDLFGDVGTTTTFDHYTNSVYWQRPHFMVNGFARYSFHPVYAVKLGLSYGTLYATDEYNKKLGNKNPTWQNKNYLLYLRNLDVKSKIFDASLTLQMMPMKYIKEQKDKKFQPFIETGITLFHFNPMGTYKNAETGATTWEELKPLHLEGEGLGYEGAPKGFKLWQVAVPIGAGFHYNYNKYIDLELEYMYRYCFTDYLDGVSEKYYVDPAVFDKNLSKEDAVKAKAMYMKAGELDPNLEVYSASNIRGNASKRDGYSSFLITVSYKFLAKEARVANDL